MKRLLLLLPLLLTSPALADLGPADILLPGETFVDWYTAQKAKKIEAYTVAVVVPDLASKGLFPLLRRHDCCRDLEPF